MSGSATSNGARTGGLKEKPKMASRTTSLAASAVESVFSASLGSEAGSVGISMLVHCVCRRCVAERRERETLASGHYGKKQDDAPAGGWNGPCIYPLIQAARSDHGSYEPFVQTNGNKDSTF